MPYSSWTREELIKELEVYKAGDLPLLPMTDSLNLLETLHSAQTDFVTVDSERNIFNRMLDNFLAVTGCEYGFIDELLYEDDGSMYLVARALTDIAWDDGSRALYKRILTGEITFNNLNSIYGEVMKTGKPYITNDAPQDPRRSGVPPGHPALKTWLGIPLHAGGKFVGVMGLANKPGGFDESILSYLDPLVRICSIIMLSFRIDCQRRQAIESLEESAAALASSNEALQTFAYRASHDLQEPLRMVWSFGAILRDEHAASLDQTGRECLDFMLDGSRRMKLLIRDLHEFSLIGHEPKELVPTDCNQLVRDVLADLTVVSEENEASVTVHDLPTLNAFPGMLQTVFQNLVSNAIKYRSEASPRIEISARREDNAWLFSVSDNGIGVAEANQQRIFEIFERLHRREEYEGTGIGLAIVKKIVEQHGGRIWIESAPGEGATFSFAIPTRR